MRPGHQRRTRHRSCAAALAVASIAVVACTADDDAQNNVVVFAAASLTDAFMEIETSFEATHPDLDVQLNLAGSSSLRVQILDGAPADVFASADEQNMAQIVSTGAAAEPSVFARNTLQIAVPADNPGNVTGIEDFSDPDLLIGLCADGVPCGIFGRQALSQAGVSAAVDTNEPDVRSLLTKIGADELDAGIVYLTDVLAAGALVEGIALPASVDVSPEYPIVALNEAPNTTGAELFVDFVLSADGQATLAEFGFEAP